MKLHSDNLPKEQSTTMAIDQNILLSGSRTKSHNDDLVHNENIIANDEEEARTDINGHIQHSSYKCNICMKRFTSKDFSIYLLHFVFERL